MSKRTYGQNSSKPNGRPEDKTKCIQGVWGGPMGMFHYQCSRNRGHGPKKEYCKQHANMLKS